MLDKKSSIPLLILKLVLHFFVMHFIPYDSWLLKFLCVSKCSWQKVYSHIWQILNSEMQALDLHALLLHKWHFTQWVGHIFLLHLKQLHIFMQSSHNTFPQVLHAFTLQSLLYSFTQFTHRDLRTKFSFLMILSVLSTVVASTCGFCSSWILSVLDAVEAVDFMDDLCWTASFFSFSEGILRVEQLGIIPRSLFLLNLFKLFKPT